MKETYLNSRPMVRNCDTCAHQKRIEHYYSPQCLLTGYFCKTQRKFPSLACDDKLSGWTPRPPKPPRRSLRQWLYDLIWK